VGKEDRTFDPERGVAEENSTTVVVVDTESLLSCRLNLRGCGLGLGCV